MGKTHSRQTYVYKTVQGCQIRADVYGATGRGPRPVILWLHGGALIFGDRRHLLSEQRELYLSAGYTVVSADYRLAPEVKLEAILEDVSDAYRWVREQGPGLFGSNPDRIAVIGHSAGGYLTLMAGWMVRPRPQALVSFYGYGDIAGAWYSRPDPHYLKEPAVTPEAARRGVGGPVLTGTPSAGAAHRRWLFYLFCRQQGLWPQEVAGHDPQADPQAFDRFCPDRNVAPDYPPTLLLHGDRDTDVPIELSRRMAAALQAQHVRHRLVTMEGMGHVFDALPDGSLEGRPRGMKHPRVAEAFAAVLAFLSEYMDR